MEKKKEVNFKEERFVNSNSDKEKNQVTNRVLYKQQYRKVWEQLPEFNGWLEPDPKNKARAFCNVCKKFLHAHRLTLLKHTASIKHMKKAQQQYEEKQQVLAANKDKLVKKNTNDSLSGENCDQVDCNFKIKKQNESAKDILKEQEDIDHSVTTVVHIELNEEASDLTNNPVDLEATPVPPLIIKPPISTHVLDTAKGLPVAGLPVSLYKLVNGRWTLVYETFTNPDGRCSDLISRDDVEPGRFKLHFDTDKYYEVRKNDRLYPFIEIVFDLRSPMEHVHIPLLITPYGYTTYKGS